MIKKIIITVIIIFILCILGLKISNMYNKKFIYNEWIIYEFLGTNFITKEEYKFDTNDILNKKIIIKENLFSTKELENIIGYKIENERPIYKVTKKDYVYSLDDKYTEYIKDILYLDNKDKLTYITVNGINFIKVNNNRLILYIDDKYYELKVIS